MRLQSPRVRITIRPDSATEAKIKFMACRQFKVSGRVQGVFFRVSTRDVAVPLRITGHAVNLPDGSVEVLACGNLVALQQLERWLHDGPPLATVENVAGIDIECEQPQRFTVE